MQIDPNFKSESKLKLDDICFYNVKENPWCLFGLIKEDHFRRMPKAVAAQVNAGVQELHTNTSGGRVRFRTDSPYVAISAVMPTLVYFPHMPDTGISGFDMYVDGSYIKTFIPPEDVTQGFEGVYHFEDRRERNIMIHFPLYNNVKDLYIGLKDGASLQEHTPYSTAQKIVFYGSSITQGGCASRPGMAYPAQVSQKLNCDFINLGFSASAKGEPVMARYIAGLNPDLFVLDYDHNAPTLEFLEKTHEVFFRTFREHQKEVPVVFMTAPNVRFADAQWRKRADVVYRTYQNAVAAGDRNVYFIDGAQLWGEEDWQMCTVDALHPNDLGHYRMAQNVIRMIRELWEC